VTALTVLVSLGIVLPLPWSLKKCSSESKSGRKRDRRRATRWLTAPRSAGHPWPFAAVVLVCGVWTVHFLPPGLRVHAGGLFAGLRKHLVDGRRTQFAAVRLRNNFPPEYPIDPGIASAIRSWSISFAASLVPLGIPLTSALVLTTGLLGLAFPGVLYLAAHRFAAAGCRRDRRLRLSLLSGGFGFYFLLGDIPAQPVWRRSVHLPREYTLNRS